jgi:N-acetylglucosamine kinase-like BadF-type ATPase
MILYVDGGSTKCDWAGSLKNDGKVSFRCKTDGINPVYHSDVEIQALLDNSSELKNLREVVNEVYFFGAGCGKIEFQERIKAILIAFFANAYRIEVNGDILGAVKACTSEKGVVSILGTGSNICYYDGEQIDLRIPSLGYTLMDHGSGNAIGRKMLQAYYFKTMPLGRRIHMAKYYNLEVEYVNNKLYRQPGVSSYLAGFARYLFDNLQDPFLQKILDDCIEEFFFYSVLPFELELKSCPLHFVGSIAYFSKPVLQKKCEERNIRLGNVVRNPLTELVRRMASNRNY